MTRISNLLAIGLDTELAQKALSAGYTLSKLKASPKYELAKHFTEQEVENLWQAVKRKPITQATIERLIQDCDWKCCLCWDYKKESPVIIHHIVKHAKSQDDSYDNLVVLCLDHHAKAHSKWEISRSPWPPELIRHKKNIFIKAIAEFKAGLRHAPGNEPHLLTHVTSTAPSPPTRFIGRRRDLLNLTEVLNDSCVVTYTIQGMGGVGKTTLVQKIATDLTPRFPGGVFWGALPDHSGNPTPILHRWAYLCAKALPPDIDAEGLSQLIRGILTDQQNEKGRLLIIVDDVRKEWLEAAKLLRRAIPRNTSAIFTTRDETLAAALDTEIYYLHEMSPDEALELFRVYAGAPDTTTELELANSLLEILGYLPLAIELAGKRLSLLKRKPGYHLEKLYQAVKQQALDTLSLPGHPGLVATFAITYEALSPKEQRLFRWLSVFAEGSLKLTNITGMLEDNKSGVESMLDNLVNVALLAWGEVEGEFTLHPLLRQYSDFLLNNENSEAEASLAKQRHLNYYLALTEIHAYESVQAHKELETELPNLLKAIDYAVNTEQHETLNQFALGLWTDSGFLPRRGYVRTALKLLTDAKTACQRIGNRRGECIHLCSLGAAYTHLGDIDTAVTCYKQALTISRELKDRHNECACLGNLGLIQHDLGDVEQAISLYKQALEIAYETHNEQVILDQLGNLGSAHRGLRLNYKAMMFYEMALTMSRKCGSRLSEGNNLSNLGLIYYDLRNFEKAEELIGEALEISREIGDRRGEGNRLGHLGNIYFYSGKVEKAVTHYKQAIDISREIEYKVNEGNWLGNLGNVYQHLNRIDEAISLYEQALAISRAVKHPKSEGIWLRNLGMIYRDLRQWEMATSYFEQALVTSHRLHDKHAERVDLNNLGLISKLSGSLKKAIHYHKQSLKISQELGDQQAEGLCLDQLGFDYLHLGDINNAIEYQKQALSVSLKIGDRHLEANSLNNLGVCYLHIGQTRQAIDFHKRAMAICDEINALWEKGIVLGDLGVAYLYAGAIEEARNYLEQALQVNRQVRNMSKEAFALGNLGNVYQLLEHAEMAVEHHEKALSISRELEDFVNEANWLGALGNSYMLLKDPERSVKCFKQGLTISRKFGNRGLEGRCLQSLGIAYRELGYISRSIDYFEQALNISAEIGDLHLESGCLSHLGVSCQELGNLGKAIQFFEQSLTLKRKIEDVHGEATICWELGNLYKDFDPMRAAELMSITVTYERKYNLPDAEEHDKKLQEIQSQL